jgi:hypothetical protein
MLKESTLWREKMRETDQWQYRVLRDALSADRRAGRGFDPTEYVTTPFVESLQTKQQNLCWHCEKFMDWLRRNTKDGLTLERLRESEPHIRSNCVLACKSCNSARLSREKSLLKKYFYRWYRKTFDVRVQVNATRAPSFV